MEVSANAVLTDTEIIQQSPFCRLLNSIVLTLALIIGKEWEKDRRRGRTCEEHRSNNSSFYYSIRQVLSLLSRLRSARSFSFSAGAVTSSLSQRPEPRAGIKKHRVRSVYYLLRILYAMRRHKHPDKEAHKTHSHQKAIFELRTEERRRKTNMSSAGGRGRVGESVES